MGGENPLIGDATSLTIGFLIFPIGLPAFTGGEKSFMGGENPLIGDATLLTRGARSLTGGENPLTGVK